MKPRSCWLLVVLVLAVSGCAYSFRPVEIAADKVPAEVREDHEDENPIWRACYEQDGYTIVWAEATEHSQVFYSCTICRPDASGKLQKCGRGSAYEPPYDWSCGEGSLGSISLGDVKNVIIFAQGLAFSSGAYRAVGELTNGRKVEGPVVNGFWCLVVDDPPYGGFVSVDVLDDQGATVTFEKYPYLGWWPFRVR